VGGGCSFFAEYWWWLVWLVLVSLVLNETNLAVGGKNVFCGGCGGKKIIIKSKTKESRTQIKEKQAVQQEFSLSSEKKKNKTNHTSLSKKYPPSLLNFLTFFQTLSSLLSIFLTPLVFLNLFSLPKKYPPQNTLSFLMMKKKKQSAFGFVVVVCSRFFVGGGGA